MSALWWTGRCPVSDDENLSEQLLDLLLYAPIGLLLEAKDLIPKLADRGRGQVALTQLAGKVVTNRGRHETGPLFRQILEAAGAAFGSMTTDEHELSDDLELTDYSGDRVEPGDDALLAISDYNTFSTPQLLPELEALSREQLNEVLAYEQAHRNRTTVTNRIKQLSTRH